MIIYPPIIGDLIPAFTVNRIIIPFSHNPAVSWDDVKGFKLLIKNYQDSTIITTLDITKKNHKDLIQYDSNTQKGNLIFNFSSWKPTNKQFYKFQISYTDNDSYLVYSSASVGKCIGNQIDVKIEGLDKTGINIDKQLYEVNLKSYPERLYSYRFQVLNEGKNIIQDTQDILFTDDTVDTIQFKQRCELQAGLDYYLRYSFITINNYSGSVEYKIQKNTNSIKCPLAIQTLQNTMAAIDNGYSIITLSKNNGFNAVDIPGEYIVERRKIEENQWVELFMFKVLSTNNPFNTNPNYQIQWKDCTLEQGIEYIYSVKKYISNDKTYTNKSISNPSIKIDFEDIFLSDGKKQLKIRFNPKVSSFKTNILEQKTDTIGGKYPFFLRNGSVGYKEIPISGLISYQMDESEMFMFNEEIGLTDRSVSGNITAERKFRLAVQEWLQNGKPKLFRSAAEGNYIIRLMNISLTPIDTVGRMLYNFSATGYEIAGNDFDSLVQHDLFVPSSPIINPLSTMGYFILGDENSLLEV